MHGMDGIAVGPDGGEKLARGPRHHRILAELPDLEVIELRFGPDFEGVDAHTHGNQTDSFFLLDGEAEFRLGVETVGLGPVSYVASPPGDVRGCRVGGAVW